MIYIVQIEWSQREYVTSPALSLILPSSSKKSTEKNAVLKCILYWECQKNLST